MPERLLPTAPASGCVPAPPPLPGLAPDAVPGVAALSLASCRAATAAPAAPSSEPSRQPRGACRPTADGCRVSTGRESEHPQVPADSSGFFPHRRLGRPGIAVFLNAGDPPLETLPELVAMLDDSDIDCLELAVPFPDSVTDGPVIRRSADRALSHGISLDAVLDAVATVRPSLRRLRIALLADWSHTVKDRDLGDFSRAVADAGCDGLLLHGLPPRLRPAHYEAAHRAGLPLVTTCYAVSAPKVVAEAAAHASAYLYLVAHYGRSGTTTAPDHDRLAATLTALRARTRVPVAVGFGVRTGADISALAELGADAAVVGSAGVARIERALAQRRDPVREFASFVTELRRPAVGHRHPRRKEGSHT